MDYHGHDDEKFNLQDRMKFMVSTFFILLCFVDSLMQKSRGLLDQ